MEQRDRRYPGQLRDRQRDGRHREYARRRPCRCNNGSILRSYATGAVSGGSQGVGGLVGCDSGGTPAATIVDSMQPEQ